MGIQRSRPDYTVWVDRRRFGDSRFVIEAALEYRPGLTEAQRERLTPMAQLELLLAIQGEEERGRLLGAESVRVRVFGDERLQGFFGGRTHAARKVIEAYARPLGRGASAGAVARSVQEA